MSFAPQHREKRWVNNGLVSDFGYGHKSPTTPFQAAEYEARLERERRDLKRHYGDVRRARLLNAPVVEKVRRSHIIERDNSTCYLCGKLCGPKEIHLDHVVPLSRGGHHSAANLRVSCPHCNLSKGSKLLTS